MRSANDRSWGIAVHLSALLGLVLPFGAVLGPLVVWLVRRNESTFIESSGRVAVNFQATVALVQYVILGLLFLPASLSTSGEFNPTPFVLPTAALGLLSLVLRVVSVLVAVAAAVRVSGDKTAIYPPSIPFLKARRAPQP